MTFKDVSYPEKYIGHVERFLVQNKDFGRYFEEDYVALKNTEEEELEQLFKDRFGDQNANLVLSKQNYLRSKKCVETKALEDGYLNRNPVSEEEVGDYSTTTSPATSTLTSISVSPSTSLPSTSAPSTSTSALPSTPLPSTSPFASISVSPALPKIMTNDCTKSLQPFNAGKRKFENVPKVLPTSKKQKSLPFDAMKFLKDMKDENQDIVLDLDMSILDFEDNDEDFDTRRDSRINFNLYSIAQMALILKRNFSDDIPYPLLNVQGEEKIS